MTPPPPHPPPDLHGKKSPGLIGLKNISFSFIHHCYLTYANIACIAWGSTHQSKLKKLCNQQKHASRIIFNKDITTHSRPLLKSLNALNVYQ